MSKTFNRREFLSRALKIVTSSIILLVTDKKRDVNYADVYINTAQNIAVWRK